MQPWAPFGRAWDTVSAIQSSGLLRLLVFSVVGLAAHLVSERMFGYDWLMGDADLDPNRLENLRRSNVMLPPGRRGLDGNAAVRIVEELPVAPPGAPIDVVSRHSAARVWVDGVIVALGAHPGPRHGPRATEFPLHEEHYGHQ